MDPVTLFLIVVFSVFTQSVAGFGLGLIAMPLIVETMGAPAATSLIALVAVVVRTVLIIRYRQALKIRTVRQMVLASLIALPIGVFILQRLDSPIVLILLGIVVFCYALYALLNLRLPEIIHPAWAYGAGFASGLLTGAYSTGGPPLVMYGTSCHWNPDEFRSNIQGVAVTNTLLAILLHYIAQDYTAAVWADFLVVLPATILGIIIGLVTARFINPLQFRRLVLVMLLFISLNLIF